LHLREQKAYVHTEACEFVNVHRSIIHHSQKGKHFWVCPSAFEGINKVWYSHTVEYYSTVERNDLRAPAEQAQGPEFKPQHGQEWSEDKKTFGR
jgi:hypothetical protein